MRNQMNGLTDQVESKAQNIARDTQHLAEDGLKSAQKMAGDLASDFRAQAEQVWKRSDEVVKANPYYFVAGTAVAGLALGYILGRSTSSR